MKKECSADTLYKAFIYVVLITLAVLIIVPVAWVFLASVKQNSEFYGNPWALPAGFYWQNFVEAWTAASMGSYMLNSVVVTALPFTIYLLSGYFATLPHDFEEAAYIDGAGYGATMVRVIFPMAQPSILTIILFNFLSFWNEYIISMTLMNSATGQKTLPVGLLNLMQASQSAAQYGRLYAGLLLATLYLYNARFAESKNKR